MKKTLPTRKRLYQFHMRTVRRVRIRPIDIALPRGDAGRVASVLVALSRGGLQFRHLLACVVARYANQEQPRIIEHLRTENAGLPRLTV
jgi:hypothetical protein